MEASEENLDNFRWVNLGEKQDTRLTNIRLLDTKTGASTTLTNFGPTMLDFLVPGENDPVNILLGYPSIADYVADGSYNGDVVVGRVGNRIENATYKATDRITAHLSANDGPNSLHGGEKGWSSKMWRVVNYDSDDHTAHVLYSLESPDGDQGYRGTVRATAKVTLYASGHLRLDYMAKSLDGITSPVNMVFHGYFNLDGVDSEGKPTTTIHNHTLQTNANRWQRTEEGLLVPTHDIESVDGTPYDFREPHKVGEEKRFGKTGYDNSLVFPTDAETAWVNLTSESGRSLTMRTDQETFQLYAGFFLAETIFKQYGGICMEAQRLVNLINMPEHWEENGGEFKSPMISRGNPYHHTTMFEFNQQGGR